jgi:hypothetical protein
VTTDRGAQFQSALFRQFVNLLGCEHIHTTAYHPAANGLVERFHRHLKASLRAHADSRWTERLPLTMLSIRSTLKEDLGCTAAELVYGTTLRLPGDLLQCSPPAHVASSNYAARLRKYMADLRPTPTRQHTGHSQIPEDLHTSSHVFVRCDAPRRPLQTPYTGPYRVVSRSAKFFVLDMNGRQDAVSIDRLKPAHLDSDFFASKSQIPPTQLPTDRIPDSTPSPPATSKPAIPASQPSSSPVPAPLPTPSQTTRSGRHVRLPSRFR